MYVSMKPILEHAAKNGYAVMAANALNMEMARAIISAADEKQAPLIIILGAGAMEKHSTPELMVPMIRRLAEETDVPIALCLDHGKDICKVAYALHNGFSSIMLDGSQYSMEENISKTKEIVEICHSIQVGVEGEIGHVGQAAALDGRDDSLYTRPEDAAYFAKGIVFNKYTGSRGKSGSNDANAEYMAELRKILDKHNVAFQTAELGKVDIGGGGTIAYILALYGMQVIDCGVAVMSMHAPWEIVSKADVYEAKKCYMAFLAEQLVTERNCPEPVVNIW